MYSRAIEPENSESNDIDRKALRIKAFRQKRQGLVTLNPTKKPQIESPDKLGS